MIVEEGGRQTHNFVNNVDIAMKLCDMIVLPQGIVWQFCFYKTSFFSIFTDIWHEAPPPPPFTLCHSWRQDFWEWIWLMGFPSK